MRPIVLSVLALAVVACGDDDAAPSSPNDGGASEASASPSSDGGAGPGPGPGGDAGSNDDVEGEPATLAVDPKQGTDDCKGPFNCVLPNPDKSDRNRMTNPKTGTKDWPVFGQPPIFDGSARSRGKVLDSSIQINYGQRKLLLGLPHVYAFSAKTDDGQASSWVAEGSIKDADEIAKMPTVAARDPGMGDYSASFTIRGGDASVLALYGDAKVVSKSTSNNEAATDYLLRPGNVVNMLYALPGSGGVSNDTWPANVDLAFRRARGVASVYVPLYTKGTDTVIGTQRFIYGRVGDRFGWMARDALGPAPAKPGPGPKP